MAYILLITIFMVILIQDIRSRSIHWVTIPILLLFVLNWNKDNLSSIEITKNILFLVIVFSLLIIYLRLRIGKWVNLLKEHFGIGDLLFLVAISPITNFPNFVLLFTIGTLFSLIIHLFVLLFNKRNSIPYAGYFSLFLILFISLEQFFHVSLINFTEIY